MAEILEISLNEDFWFDEKTYGGKLRVMWMAEGEAKGKAEGEAKGKAEGEAKGKAEGEKKGKAEGEKKGEARALAIVRGLLKGLPPSQLSQQYDLPLEKIEKIRDEIQ